MSSTHREWGLPARVIAAWILFTVFAAAAGPFGTLESLSPGGRIAYWGGTVALGIGLTLLRLHLLRGVSWAVRLAAQLPYSLAVAGTVHVLNLFVFPGWGGWTDLLYLFGVVLLTVTVITAAAMVWTRGAAPGPAAAQPRDAPPELPEAQFMHRLPSDRRGSLIRLEAQDHYLNVVTGAGAALILMRISDAEAELAGVEGLRVHRSHWVARAAVRHHLRRDGRDFLVMRDGVEVPVSRSCRPAVVAAGLI